MMMETTMYQDDGLNNHDSLKVIKKNMTLDFAASTKKQKVTQLLQSPDLQMLKLASPELERMIIQANGMVTTTPTPTQYMFPKYVTEEQENYAKGFIEALSDLHKHNGPVAMTTALTTDLAQCLNSVASFAPSISTSDSSSTNSLISVNIKQEPTLESQLSTTTALPGGLFKPVSVSSSQSNFPTTVESLTNRTNIRVPQVKEEPQTVPCMGGTPPLSPINMESQERIKLERKRARNRVAARKCRTRKLERISRLEDRVDNLKGQNNTLSNTATSLKEEVCRLKQQIIEHVQSGCQIMMTGNLNF